MLQRSTFGVAVIVAAVLCAPLRAVTTSHWTHTSEADFKKGKFHNVVATNLGDLKLSRAVKTLLEQDPKISSVYAMVEARDGTIYAGTGPEGVVLSIKDEKVTPLVTLDHETNVFSLLIDNDGRLLIGTGGDKGRILRIEKPGDKPHEIFSHDGVQYVWSMRQTPDGLLYAATGPEGQLFTIKPDGSHEILFDSDENNLLSMTSDGKDLLFVGTDPNGLVYRINRKTKEAFVLYDAAESEVSALALDKSGNLYAGTAEAGEEPSASANAEGAGEAKDQRGRPEGSAPNVPIPSEPPPENPKPPELPNPNPGQPEPEPKKSDGMQMLLFTPDSRPSVRPVLLAVKEDDGDDDPKDPEPAPREPKQPRPGVDPGVSHGPATAPTRAGPLITGGSVTPRAEGNAIYKIQPDGFVTEIFRQPVLVLSIIEREGTLLVGTGSEGLVYQVKPAAEETIVVAKVEPKQIMSMLLASDGRVLLGQANVGSVSVMSSGLANEGTYTSPVLDAAQISRFGKLQLHGSLPAGTSLKVATRSGNVAEASDTTWSKWTPDAPATRFVPVTSPSARYLQYRLTFTGKEGKETPVVEDVDIAYQIPNLPPIVKSIRITDKPAPGGAGPDADSSATPAPARTETISWEASDPNNDTLEYNLFFRINPDAPWIQLKSKLKEATYDWDTRTVGDGRYEIRVVATDAPSNPPGSQRTASRVSDPVVVDNTAPVLSDVRAQAKGAEVRVDVKVTDRTSTIQSMHYNVDSNADWQDVLPSDNIWDSNEDTASFTVSNLSAGAHQITIRATDARGNQAFETVQVKTEAPAARGNGNEAK